VAWPAAGKRPRHPIPHPFGPSAGERSRWEQVESPQKNALFRSNRRLALPNDTDFLSIYRHNDKTVGLDVLRKTLRYLGSFRELADLCSRLCSFWRDSGGIRAPFEAVPSAVIGETRDLSDALHRDAPECHKQRGLATKHKIDRRIIRLTGSCYFPAWKSLLCVSGSNCASVSRCDPAILHHRPKLKAGDYPPRSN
jgi:hypothetical protein